MLAVEVWVDVDRVAILATETSESDRDARILAVAPVDKEGEIDILEMAVWCAVLVVATRPVAVWAEDRTIATRAVEEVVVVSMWAIRAVAVWVALRETRILAVAVWVVLLGALIQAVEVVVRDR